MNKYIVRITEILYCDKEIEANSREEAVEKVSNLYYQGNTDYILDYDDYYETNFECIEEQVEEN